MENIPSTTLCTEIFREYELNIANVIPRPKRLKHKIRETKHGQIFNQFLSQVMINPAQIEARFFK